MRNILAKILILLSVSLVIGSTATHLTYYSEHQVQHQQDYIQISIKVSCQDSILKNSISTARRIVQSLGKITQNYCSSHSKKKSQCQQAFTSSKHKITPKYQLVRKVQTFTGFIVDHQITIKIIHLDGIGKMTDQLLKAGQGLITIDKFQWKARNQDNPEKQALKQGLQDGEQICARMGLKLTGVLSVEEVQDNQQEQDNTDQQQESNQDQQEQEDQPEIIIFKFQVACS